MNIRKSIDGLLYELTGMWGAVHDMLKWVIASKEMKELERWRVASTQAYRYLAEFEPAAAAVRHVMAVGAGSEGYGHINGVRDRLHLVRARDEASIIRLSPAEIQSRVDRVRWAEGLIRQLPETHDGRNSWLLNYGRDKNVSKVDARDGR